MKDQDACEFQPMGFGAWLRCRVCWYTKAGFLMVAAGGILLFFFPGFQPSGIPAGSLLLKLGGLFLAFSLLRDFLVLARRPK